MDVKEVEWSPDMSPEDRLAYGARIARENEIARWHGWSDRKLDESIKQMDEARSAAMVALGRYMATIGKFKEDIVNLASREHGVSTDFAAAACVAGETVKEVETSGLKCANGWRPYVPGYGDALKKLQEIEDLRERKMFDDGAYSEGWDGVERDVEVEAKDDPN